MSSTPFKVRSQTLSLRDAKDVSNGTDEDSSSIDSSFCGVWFSSSPSSSASISSSATSCSGTELSPCSAKQKNLLAL